MTMQYRQADLQVQFVVRAYWKNTRLRNQNITRFLGEETASQLKKKMEPYPPHGVE